MEALWKCIGQSGKENFTYFLNYIIELATRDRTPDLFTVIQNACVILSAAVPDDIVHTLVEHLTDLELSHEIEVFVKKLRREKLNKNSPSNVQGGKEVVDWGFALKAPNPKVRQTGVDAFRGDPHEKPSVLSLSLSHSFLTLLYFLFSNSSFLHFHFFVSQTTRKPGKQGAEPITPRQKEKEKVSFILIVKLSFVETLSLSLFRVKEEWSSSTPRLSISLLI